MLDVGEVILGARGLALLPFQELRDPLRVVPDVLGRTPVFRLLEDGDDAESLGDAVDQVPGCLKKV
jgi:hypothetical protein